MAPVTLRRPLPIGIQTFAKLREDGAYYVDKTGLAIDLIESGGCFFLSRPRRFGKSLLLDTIKELFEANRPLFTGLAAETRWDWTRRHPVIRLDLAGGVLRSAAELDARLGELLSDAAQAQGVTLQHTTLAGRFSELIRRTRERHGERVVVLIDEYDKPILDNLGDPALATPMRDGLRNLYSVLKAEDAHLRFILLTGVSKFSQVSLFSGLNNLKDITLDARWSALCGYTDADLDTVFAPELPGLDRDEIRRWYNGYNWGGAPVYNPFDVLLLFDGRAFRPYWFETGTPTFLIDTLAQRPWFTPDLERVTATEALLSSFDVGAIRPEALLFQTGYLTIDAVTGFRGRTAYTLKYPNLEVQTRLNECLLRRYASDRAVSEPRLQRLWHTLNEGDPAELREQFHAFFASIPHDWHRNTPLAQFEGYWASVFYSYLAALGLDVRAEDATSHGRIDMTVLAPAQVFVFEFKVVEQAATGQALAQIRAKGYADKYRGRGVPVHRVGIEFGRAARNLVGFEVETIAPR